ncbi:MAG: 7TM domain-containing protein [Patescibacteria group bacterium]|nr:7TM domain-containing protein [Patescibacteria group bacterium]
MERFWRVFSVILVIGLFAVLAYNHDFRNWLNFSVSLGADAKTLLWLLLFPWVITVLSFSRQIIGLKTYGIYIPSVLAVAIFALGFQFGLLFLAAVLIIGTATRYILGNWRLLDLPRRGIIMIIAALAMVFILVISVKHQFFLANLAPVAVFPILIIIVASERFVTSQLRLPFKKAAIYTLETLVVVLSSVLLLRWPALQQFTWDYPEITIILILINFWFGRYTGLRLVELWRFRKLIFK